TGPPGRAVAGPSGQGEPFRVDLPARYVQRAQAVQHRGRHGGRAADVHVAFGDVGDQGAEVLRGEGRPVLPGPAGEQVQPPAGDRDEVPYLVGQDGVRLAAHPVEDDDVAVRVLLQQGP